MDASRWGTMSRVRTCPPEEAPCPSRSARSASSTPRRSTGSPTSCAGRSSTASSSPVRRCARSRWPSRSGVSRPTIREALGGARRRGPRHPRAQPRGVGHQSPTRTRSATSARPGRCSRSPASAAGRPRRPRHGTRSAHGAGRLHARPRTTGRRTRCSTSGTSTSTSRWSAWSGRRGWRRWPPACTPSSGSRWPRSTGPARTPPTRPGRHTLLVRLLESGDVDATVDRARAHLRAPRWRSSTGCTSMTSASAGLIRP